MTPLQKLGITNENEFILTAVPKNTFGLELNDVMRLYYDDGTLEPAFISQKGVIAKLLLPGVTHNNTTSPLVLKKQLKILVLGLKNHGKDEVAKLLCHNLKLKYASTTESLCRLIVYPKFSKTFPELFYSYQDCLDAKDEWRPFWYNAVQEVNAEIYQHYAAEKVLYTADVYVGMRHQKEVDACLRQNLFDYVFYVDATQRKGVTENSHSCTVVNNTDEYVQISNNGTMADLRLAVKTAASTALTDPAYHLRSVG